MTEAVAGAGAPADPDVVVIGVGFSALYMPHRLRRFGLARVPEAAENVAAHGLSTDRAHHGAGGADGACSPMLVQRGQCARQEADAHGLFGGIPEYRRRCEEIAATGYTGFRLR